jgi:hypothetical protein
MLFESNVIFDFSEEKPGTSKALAKNLNQLTARERQAKKGRLMATNDQKVRKSLNVTLHQLMRVKTVMGRTSSIGGVTSVPLTSYTFKHGRKQTNYTLGSKRMRILGQMSQLKHSGVLKQQ